jgi:hypothetical protein
MLFLISVFRHIPGGAVHKMRFQRSNVALNHKRDVSIKNPAILRTRGLIFCNVSRLFAGVFLDLFDDIGGGTAIFKVQHQHFTAVRPNFFTSGDLFGFIVPAFYQTIR